jgi:hypothetical protein
MSTRLSLGFMVRLRLPLYHKWPCMHNVHRLYRNMSSYRRRDLPLYANAENCSDRTFIVTGANTGLGFEATKHLVAAGSVQFSLQFCNNLRTDL